jgi:hypothetical protein
VSTKLVLKVLIGCLLALTALFTILGTVVIANVKQLQAHLVAVIATLGFAGLALIVLERWRSKPAATSEPESGPVSPADEAAHPLAFFRRLDFWGSIVVVAAFPIFVWSSSLIRAGKTPHFPLARHVSAATPPAPAPSVVPEPPAKFPRMLLRGIVWNGEKSTAVINGLTLQKGDTFEGVKVLNIDSNSVSVGIGSSSVCLKLE